MSRIFVNIGLSLDGYMAPEGMTMSDPGFKNWGAKWSAMMAWLLKQQHFREHVLELGPGGETGPENDLVRTTFGRIGANIMGKRMFDQGEVAWPEDAPFHTPVSFLPTKSANRGRVLEGRPSISSTTGLNMRWRWPEQRQASGISALRVAPTSSSST